MISVRQRCFTGLVKSESTTDRDKVEETENEQVTVETEALVEKKVPEQEELTRYSGQLNKTLLP